MLVGGGDFFLVRVSAVVTEFDPLIVDDVEVVAGWAEFRGVTKPAMGVVGLLD